jgi:hypothetical protein
MCTVRTIHVTKKLGAQTKRLKVLICYDFHFGISNGKEDVMFVIRLDLFSIGTKKILTHIESVSKVVHIPNLSIANLSQPHLEGSVRSPLTLLKMGLGSPSELSKT